MLNIIPDGYTEEGYIAEDVRLHGELRFSYRPMLAEDRDAIEKVARAGSAVQAHALYRKAVASRVTNWSEQDAHGVPVPINDANLKRMRPLLFDRLYNVVSGFRASDADPTRELTPEEIDHELEAAITGQPVGDVRAEANAKN